MDEMYEANQFYSADEKCEAIKLNNIIRFIFWVHNNIGIILKDLLVKFSMLLVSNYHQDCFVK